MPFSFAKMQGLGNDFIVLPHFDAPEEEYARLACAWCDRHTGIGADGLILAGPSRSADLSMRIFNSDGSEARMCGNGIRCLAHYALAKGLAARGDLSIETKAGLRYPKIIEKSKYVYIVTVDMGMPGATRGAIPMEGPADAPSINVEVPLDDEVIIATCISVGNPHCVVFRESFIDGGFERLGPRLERHPFFPDRTNVELVQVIDREHLRAMVWERGAGATLACGTGACASVVAGALTGRTERKAQVILPGGSLDIEWRRDGRIHMTGPSVLVFEGTIDIP
jgi:diaminopimelate epimerase